MTQSDIAYVKHREQQVLLARLVLITKEGEHDRLQQRVDLGHGHLPRQARHNGGVRLQQEEQVAVREAAALFGDAAALEISVIVQMARKLLLCSQTQIGFGH